VKILQVNSSSKGPQSHSSRLADELSKRLLSTHPSATLKVRDLGRSSHPALDEAALQALFTPAEQRSPVQAARVALDDALIAELMDADVLVLAAPMYNFTIPSTLKSWFDAIARAGVTFRYTDMGPVGLVSGKKVYVVSTRGGTHIGQPTDQVTSYMQTMLGFLGMTDVHFVYAEGLAMGPDVERRSLGEAHRRFDELMVSANAA